MIHGQQHVCLVRPETIIVWDDPRQRWEWQLPEKYEGHTNRYEVLRCPFCGCPPHLSECEDDD